MNAYSRVEIIGNATLYLGDCRDVMPTLGKVDAMVTDPPYGVMLGQQKDWRGNHVLVKPPYESYEDTAENFAEVVVPAVSGALTKVERGLVFVSAKTAWMLPPPDAIGGVYLPSAQGRFIWGFRSFAPCLLYGHAPNLQLGCRATAFQSTDIAEKNGHPCPKPIAWMRWALGLASLPYETVFDPFMGSGTTGVAAVRMGRKFIGVEIEPRYFDIACKRVDEAVRQPDMFIERPKALQERFGFEISDEQRRDDEYQAMHESR